MVTEKALIFSNAQAITASTATDSTNVIDTEFATPNLGGGTPLWLVCRVNTTFVAPGSTLTVKLSSSATSGGTYLTDAQSQAFTVGTCVKGLDLLTIPLPLDHLRYLKLTYTPATGSGPSAGNIDAYIALTAPRN